ncbi:MAG TPA: helix-turn-helix domain-containing protein [Chitinophagaceae bacterium]|jgi:excisionase family DNA binding protein
MSSNIKIRRICVYCRREFIAKTTKTQTCSDQCAKKLYKQKKKQENMDASNVETTKIKLQPVAEINSKPFLSAGEAAMLLGLSVRTVNRLIKSGIIPAVNLGKRLTRIARAELDKLMLKNQQ